IPEHLMTREFLEEVKAIMTDDGVLVSNTFSTSALYDHESVTYRDVFGPFFNFKMPTTGNRVIIASGSGLPSDEIIKARAEVFSARLDPYGVKIEDYPAYMDRGVDWDTTRRPLTDQYAPANLLNSEGD
ncbi:MAG: hypothetical protein KDI19_16410, partial [Pseudomonadales bacterium]|nr:hypothetical protein [Pseudomonadales bacterium]